MNVNEQKSPITGYLDLSLLSIYRYIAVALLVEYCATSRKVAGSIPDGVIGIFYRLNT